MKHLLFTLFVSGFSLFGFAQKTGPFGPIVCRCAPCGMACDTLQFEAGSTCPQCGVGLFASYRHLPIQPKIAAILLFPRIDMMDFAWFFEICREAGMKVITIAETRAPVKAVLNSIYEPDYTFEDAPTADFIFIAGGGIDLNNQPMQSWLRKASPSTKAILTSFNGSHLLAKAGLLDGKSATAANYALEQLQNLAPKSKIVDDQHFVEEGNIITAAGITATIDATLYLISKYIDGYTAQMIANGLEYHWDTPNLHLRAELAEPQNVYLDGLMSALNQFDTKTLKDTGDAKQWLLRCEINTKLNKEELKELLDFQLKTIENWSVSNQGIWTFQHGQKTFTAQYQLEAQAGFYLFNLEIK